MAETNLNMIGREFDFDLLFDGQPGEGCRGYVETANFSPRTVDFDDKIVNRAAYKIDIITVGWEFSLEVFVASLALKNRIDQYHTLKRTHRNPPTIGFTAQAAIRDGSFSSFVITPCTITYRFTPGAMDAKSKMSITGKGETMIALNQV